MGAATSAQGGRAPRIHYDAATDAIGGGAKTGSGPRKAVRRGKELEAKLEYLKQGLEDVTEAIEEELKAEDEKKERKIYDHKKKKWVKVKNKKNADEDKAKSKPEEPEEPGKRKKKRRSLTDTNNDDNLTAEQIAAREARNKGRIQTTASGTIIPAGYEYASSSSDDEGPQRDWIKAANSAMRKAALIVGAANAFGLGDVGGDDDDRQRLTDSIPSQLLNVFYAEGREEESQALLSTMQAQLESAGELEKEYEAANAKVEEEESRAKAQHDLSRTNTPGELLKAGAGADDDDAAAAAPGNKKSTDKLNEAREKARQLREMEERRVVEDNIRLEEAALEARVMAEYGDVGTVTTTNKEDVADDIASIRQQHKEALEKAKAEAERLKEERMEQLNQAIGLAKEAAVDIDAILSTANGHAMFEALQRGLQISHPEVRNTRKWADAPINAQEVASERHKVIVLAREGKIACNIFTAHARSPADPQRVLALENGWKLLNQFLPAEGNLVRGERIEGITMVARLVMAVSLRVRELGGQSAVDNFRIVIHTSAKVDNLMIADAINFNFYGFKRENVYFLPQEDLPGYVWSNASHVFKPDASSSLENYGTGYAMKQLAWGSSAYQIDYSNKRQPVKMSVFDALGAGGVEWLLSNRIDDSEKYGDEAFPIDFLAYCMKVRAADVANANMFIDSAPKTGLMDVRKAGQAILHARYKNGKPAYKEGEAHKTAVDLFGDDGSPMCAKVIKAPALVMGANAAMLTRLLTSTGNRVWVGTGRYVFHLKSIAEPLKRTLRSPSGTPLGVIMRNGTLYPQFSVGDLTLTPGVTCVALEGSGELLNIQLSSNFAQVSTDIAKQFQRMDRRKQFQAHAAAAAHDGKVKLVLRNIGKSQRFNVAVAAANDEASRMAFAFITELLSPGMDKVSLLHVSSSVQEAAHVTKIFSLFEPENRLLEVNNVSLVAGGGHSGKPLSKLQEECDALRADFLVMGSEVLAKAESTTAALGSLALAAVKELTIPVLVMKRNAKLAFNSEARAEYGDKPIPITVLLHAADFGVMDALKFLKEILRVKAGDEVVVSCENAQGDGKERQRQLLAAIDSELETAHIESARQAFNKGNTARSISRTARERHCDLVVITAPPQRGISPEVAELLHIAPCPVLVWMQAKRLKSDL